MRTRLQQKYGIVKDARSVEDPLGAGITFQIRRKGHPTYKAFVETMAGDNKLSQAFQVEFSRQQMKASMTGKKIDKEAAIDRAIDRAGLDLGSANEFIGANVKRIAHLLDGWTGHAYEDGSPVEFSLEAAVELLSLENHLDPELPFATRTIESDEEGVAARTIQRNLGEALQAFIEEEADKEALFVEGLAKNSVASSAGAPDSSGS